MLETGECLVLSQKGRSSGLHHLAQSGDRTSLCMSDRPRLLGHQLKGKRTRQDTVGETVHFPQEKEQKRLFTLNLRTLTFEP